MSYSGYLGTWVNWVLGLIGLLALLELLKLIELLELLEFIEFIGSTLVRGRRIASHMLRLRFEALSVSVFEYFRLIHHK